MHDPQFVPAFRASPMASTDLFDYRADLVIFRLVHHLIEKAIFVGEHVFEGAAHLFTNVLGGRGDDG